MNEEMDRSDYSGRDELCFRVDRSVLPYRYAREEYHSVGRFRDRYGHSGIGESVQRFSESLHDRAYRLIVCSISATGIVTAFVGWWTYR